MIIVNKIPLQKNFLPSIESGRHVIQLAARVKDGKLTPDYQHTSYNDFKKFWYKKEMDFDFGELWVNNRESHVMYSIFIRTSDNKRLENLKNEAKAFVIQVKLFLLENENEQI